MLRIVVSYILAAAAVSQAAPATFGKVVVIGGEASDLAFDSYRNRLYIANYTGMRIDVLSAADNKLQAPIRIGSLPASIALSPDNRYLVVAHAPSGTGPGVVPGLSVIDLGANYASLTPTPFTPLAVAFGASSKAFIAATDGLYLFDPATRVIQKLPSPDLIPGDQSVPVQIETFPQQIVSASAGVSGDGTTIVVLATDDKTAATTGSSILLRYRVDTGEASAVRVSSGPSLGPLTVSVDEHAQTILAGWMLIDDSYVILAEMPYPTGMYELGGHAIDYKRNVVYANHPSAASGGDPDGPVLHLMDTDNLTVRERIRLPEPLRGKAIFSAGMDTMYAISNSGVLVLPVGSLDAARRVKAAQEQLLFESNGCASRPVAKTFDIRDVSGQRTPFALSVANNAPGVHFSQTTGYTPATVTVEVDPTVYQAESGTVSIDVQINAPDAVNVPNPLRIRLNRRAPDQRGVIYSLPGKIVDILSDPQRTALYVLRQDTNSVLVLDATTFKQIGTLRTGNTPTQLAFAVNRSWLVVGNDHSQIANVYDLNQVIPALRRGDPVRQGRIVFPSGHYPTSIAAANTTVLAVSRTVRDTGTRTTGGATDCSGGKAAMVDLVLPSGMRAMPYFPLPQNSSPSCLGIFANDLPIGSVMLPSPSGQFIFTAMPNGSLLLYQDGYQNFPAGRNNGLTTLSGTMSIFSDELFGVGDKLFNLSLTPAGTLPGEANLAGTYTGAGSLVGLLSATSPSSAGVYETYSLETSDIVRPVRTAEAPLTPAILTTPPIGQIGQTIPTFLRTTATTSDGTKVYLSISGITALPPHFDDDRPLPSVANLGNLADGGRIAPGALFRIGGTGFAGAGADASATPLPTILGDVCATVNGVAVPLMSVGSDHIDAQLPFDVLGPATLVVTTPGGRTNPFAFEVPATAPAVFRLPVEGQGNLPMTYRLTNNDVVAFSNPVHAKDTLMIVATGLGLTTNDPAAGAASPFDPFALALAQPVVRIGNTTLNVLYAGLMPGQVGVYQINVEVPFNIPSATQTNLTVTQGDASVSMPVRVVNP